VKLGSSQADWTLTHTSHKDTEHSTIEASITLDGITLTDSPIRRSANDWPSVCREIQVHADKMFRTSNKHAKWTPYITANIYKNIQTTEWNAVSIRVIIEMWLVRISALYRLCCPFSCFHLVPVGKLPECALNWTNFASSHFPTDSSFISDAA
jgi:hypothetical protein